MHDKTPPWRSFLLVLVSCFGCFGFRLAKVAVKARDLGSTGITLEAPARTLQQARVQVVPDCGRAFQPCCPGSEPCTDDTLTCISREPAPRCEPCGAPFAQPCPSSPFCEFDELIPTTRRSNSSIQCRPCGQEWQPCCAMINNLCGGGFMCYSEQDRCVVPEYADVKEEFFPELIAPATANTPICGGASDPPCMEKSPDGPVWQCDPGLATHIPVFLCMEFDMMALTSTTNCGDQQQEPCWGRRRCAAEPMCMKTFSLRSDTDSTPDTSTSARAGLNEKKTPDESTKPCGKPGEPVCGDGMCVCGAKGSSDGSCMDDPDGCLIIGRSSQNSVLSQSGSKAALNTSPCGKPGAQACLPSTGLKDCECGTFRNETTGRCDKLLTTRKCLIDNCGHSGEQPCSNEAANRCVEGLEVLAAEGVCACINGDCYEGGDTLDQSVQCGRSGQPPCEADPPCQGRRAVDEQGICVRCGRNSDASPPCDNPPYCLGRNVAKIADGTVDLDSCVQCGDEGQPPCLDEDTGRTKAGFPQCQENLTLTVVSDETQFLALSPQQTSLCTRREFSETLQCGFQGQIVCDGGVCRGRNVPDATGELCVECGGPTQTPCVTGRACDFGLTVENLDSPSAVCLCPEQGCCGGDVMDQSYVPGSEEEEQEQNCGGLGQFKCEEEPYCGTRLIAEESGICETCGEKDGSVPCDENDSPRCGFKFVQVGDFCKPCGGLNMPVCCDSLVCDEQTGLTACNAGLFRSGYKLIDGAEVVNLTSGAYCSDVNTSAACGGVDQPICFNGTDNSAPLCGDFSTPSKDGTVCEACGRDGEPPCRESSEQCTGTAVELHGGDICYTPEPEMESESKSESRSESKSKRSGLREVSASSGGGDCGLPGMRWCTDPLCFAASRAIAHADGVCISCGGPLQNACDAGPPCNEGLRHDTRTDSCINCGGKNEHVCIRESQGLPCNDKLINDGGVCKEDKTGVQKQRDDTVDLTGVKADAVPECGQRGTAPCSRQPVCGDGLFLITVGKDLRCSPQPPDVAYPTGRSCGGELQPVCNKYPHCKGDGQLIATYPEGLCVPEPSVSATCGTLGNAPCSERPRCQEGLELRANRCVERDGTSIGEKCLYRLRENICAQSSSLPDGIRGFPISFNGEAHCERLLMPAFPHMICIDSARERRDSCGVLGKVGCLDVDCVPPLVVHPNTKVCVVPRDEPCGGAGQAQCFWDGSPPCDDKMEPMNGICSPVK